MPKHLTVDDSADFVQESQVGVASGVAPLGSDGKIPATFLPSSSSPVTSVNALTGDVVITPNSIGAVPNSSVGNPNGVAPLDSSGRLPIAKLPTPVVQSVNGYSGPSVTLTVADLGAITQTTADGRYMRQDSVVYNAKEHGAVINGTTDDAPAINSILSTSPAGSVVLLPPGDVAINSPIIVPPGKTLMGMHSNLMKVTGLYDPAVRIKPLATFSGAAAVLFVDQATGGYAAVSGEQRLIDLMIYGASAPAGTDGIQAKGNIQNVVMYGVTVRDMTGNGIYTGVNAGAYPYSWRLHRVMLDNNGSHGMSVQQMTDLTMIDCQAIGNGANGFVLNNVANSQLSSCRAEWNGNHGYYITGSWGTGTGSGGMQVSNCGTDRNGFHGVFVDATGNAPIVISNLMTRRDGRNGGAGGGGYAGLCATGATTPLVIGDWTNYPGTDDNGTGTNSPQYGASFTGNASVQLDNARLHANTAGLHNGGGNVSLQLGQNLIYATGTTAAPVTAPQAGPGSEYNVRHFGAQGDGVTDDTAAIQKAIDAGGVTFFPAGTYLTGTLEARLGTVLKGVTRSAYAYPVPGTQSSTLKLKSGTNGHLLHGATGINNVQIHDLAFDGNKAGNTSGDIIHLDDAAAQDTSWHLYDCYFDNAPHDGLYVGTGRQAVKVQRTWVMRAANNGIVMNGADMGLDTCLIGLSGSNGVYVGAWVSRLSDCDIWSSGASGVVIASGIQMVSLIGCGIDRNSQQGLYLSGSATAVTVQGCHFHSNSQQTDNTYPNISMQSSGELTVTGTTFGNDGLANMPSHDVEVYSGTLHESGNISAPGSSRSGYLYTAIGVTVNQSSYTAPAAPSYQDLKYAIEFSGSNGSNVSLGVKTYLDGAQPFTFGTWVDFYSSALTDDSAVWAYGYSSTNDKGYALRVDGTTKRLSFFWGSASNQATSLNTFCYGKMWLVVTYDGATTLKVYKNNVLMDTLTVAARTADAAIGSYLGTRDGTARNLNGALDDSFLYNRVLTAGELTAIFRTSSFPSAGNLFLYHFDERTGTTATDSSGSGNNGTINSGTYRVSPFGNTQREPSSPTTWQASLANADLTRTCALFIGSSTTQGSLSSTLDNRYTDVLGQLLHKRFNSSSVTGGKHIRAADSGWSTTGTASLNGDGLGLASYSLSAGATLSRTLTSSTGFDLHFVQGPGQGAFSYQVDGGSAVVVTPSTTGAANRHDGNVTVTGLTLGDHTLQINATNACIINGVYVHSGDSTTGVRVYNSGKGSTASADFITTNASTIWQRAAAIGNINLIAVMLSSNDFSASVNPSTFKANLLTLIHNAWNSLGYRPDIVLLNSYKRYDQVGYGTTYLHGQYADRMQEIAGELDRVQYVDLSGFFPLMNDAVHDPLDLMNTDNIHMNDAGHRYMARLLAKSLAPSLL